MLKSFLFDCGVFIVQIGVGLLILVIVLVAAIFGAFGFFIGRTWKATKYLDELEKIQQAEEIRRAVAMSRTTDL